MQAVSAMAAQGIEKTGIADPSTEPEFYLWILL